MLKACIRSMAAGFLVLLGGCLAGPVDARFSAMESRARTPLSGVPPLSRIAVDDPAPPRSVLQFLSTNLTEDAVVRVALMNNRNIQASYEQLDMAMANRLAARLWKNPEVDGSVLISEEEPDDQVLELGAELDLLHLLLIRKHSRAAEAEYKATELEVARAVQQLAYNARTAYYTLLAAQQRLAMQESNLQAADAAYDMADRLRNAGNIKLLDKLNRQALREQAALRVAAARLDVTRAREKLNVLMGLSGTNTAWQATAVLAMPENDKISQAELVETALSNSVQLAVARRRIEAATERLGITRTESVVPALHVGVEAEREPEGTWLTGPMIAVEIPLFNYGQATRAAAKADLKRRRHAYAALAVEIASAARVAWKQVAVHAERAKRYRDVIIPLRKQIMKRTQLQYNAMQVGVFQLLQAKQMEIAAQDAYISELLNYWTVKTDFAQIRSGLLVNTRSAMSKANSMPMAQEAGGH